MKIPKKLQKLSDADKGELPVRALKLCEEAGEVAEGVLRLHGRKGDWNNIDKIAMRQHIAEEAVDTIIMGMDILCVTGFTDSKYLEKLINKKLKKWQNSTKKNPKQNE